MATVVVTIASTSVFVAPPGTQAGQFRISLVNGPATLSQDVDGMVATFDNVPAGDWVSQAQRLDVSAAAIGPMVVGPTASVPVPGVNVDVPQTLTIAIQ